MTFNRIFLKLSIFILVLSIAGCGTNGGKSQHGQPHGSPGHAAGAEVQAIKVHPQIPEQIKAGQEVTLAVKVTQGDELVEDADEVVFEIWKEGQEEHEKMEVGHQKDGVYALRKQFAEPGTYYLIPHVTARGMHSMPKTEFEVLP